VYLDQWVWIRLGRAAIGLPTDVAAHKALEAIRNYSERGVASFPLSPTFYLEYEAGTTLEQRQKLWKTVVELSHQDSIRNPGPDVISWEVDLYLQQHHGRPAKPRSVPVFGTGVADTFGDSGLTRGLEIDPASIPADLSPVQREALELAARQVTELFPLAGPTLDSIIPGFNVALRSFDERFASEEAVFAAWLQQWPKQRWAAAQYTRSLVRDVLRSIADALRLAELPPSVLPSSWNGWVDLLRELPTLWALTELKRLEHANPNRAWVRQDHADLIALSMAIVHCDIMVVDNHWANHARSAMLDQLNQTVLSSLMDLPANLGRACRP
jgi:hypothetical protein